MAITARGARAPMRVLLSAFFFVFTGGASALAELLLKQMKRLAASAPDRASAEVIECYGDWMSGGLLPKEPEVRQVVGRPFR
jgi:hypothetical protein